MVTNVAKDALGTQAERKARGAFFTPAVIARYVAEWAIRAASDRVLEPSTGDAAFLTQVIEVLRERSADKNFVPQVFGAEIHEESSRVASRRIIEAGGRSQIEVGDFLLKAPDAEFDVVIGNPPYVRFQEMQASGRAASKAAALRGGVRLSSLASMWAPFTVQASLHLRKGGRLGFVLPAELLSVNYASPVRTFLFESFREIQLVLFEDQVFPDAEADVVLLLADGFGEGPAPSAKIVQAKNADSLIEDLESMTWVPGNPSAKWTALFADQRVLDNLEELTERALFSPLSEWGRTGLGMVTGNNAFFTLTANRIRSARLPYSDLKRVSPPGSKHLRRLELTTIELDALDKSGQATWLFDPKSPQRAASKKYISAGERTGVSDAYKCRIREPWYRVPNVAPADLLLTYMNSEAPQFVTNTAGAHHLNSVHGVYLKPDVQDLGKELLPLAALNSVTLLSAELEGRSYGGGILKIEPGEAIKMLIPSVKVVRSHRKELLHIRGQVISLLEDARFDDAVNLVDEVLFLKSTELTPSELAEIRTTRNWYANRRKNRGKRGK